MQQATDRFPGDRLERLLNPENDVTHEDLRQVGLPEMLSKLWDNLPGIMQNDLPRLGGSWLGAFFLVGLLVFREVGIAEALIAARRGERGFLVVLVGSVLREAGGEVFGAPDFGFMATAVEDVVVGRFVADGVGAGVRGGARQIECTVNGIGERAGNTAMEEVVMAIRTRREQFGVETGIVSEEIYATSRLVSQITGLAVQVNKAIVGENAFAHEAGIHQDGYLKNKSTYEIIDPKSVGVPEGKLVLGKHSGRHALKDRCSDLGFELTKEELDFVYHGFCELADRVKGVRNDAIASICREAKKAQGVSA